MFVSYIALLLLAYGWAGLPFTYVASLLFTVPSSGIVWLTMFNIITGSCSHRVSHCVSQIKRIINAVSTSPNAFHSN